MLTIRIAEPNDATDIAAVHVDTWQNTYKDIIPQHYLNGLTVPNRRAGWLEVLEQQTADNMVFVSEDHDRRIVGYAAVGRARSHKRFFQGEITSLYVLPAFQRRQHGKRLFMAAANRLAALRLKGLIVWVVADNPARRFYEKLGGELVGQTTRSFAGSLLQEVCYGWEETPRYD